MLEMQTTDKGNPSMQLIGAPNYWAWVSCGDESCAKVVAAHGRADVATSKSAAVLVEDWKRRLSGGCGGEGRSDGKDVCESLALPVLGRAPKDKVSKHDTRYM